MVCRQFGILITKLAEYNIVAFRIGNLLHTNLPLLLTRSLKTIALRFEARINTPQPARQVYYLFFEFLGFLQGSSLQLE
jgi:hypothetical protein